MALDEEGTEFPHLEDALTEAKDSARDLVRQFMDDRTPLGETCVEVRDSHGQVVAALTVAESTPSTRRLKALAPSPRALVIGSR